MTPGRFNPLVYRRKILSRFTWILHPISIFVAMQILSVTLISIWVVWFVGRRREIDQIVSRFGSVPLPIEQSTGTVFLVIGLIALVLILVGSVVLFIWGQRQSSLIRQQRSFVSSVTHELRTPLASLHLAYETMLTRQLDDETRKQLMSMGLVDIDRLIRLVNQILLSSRLDRGLAMFQDDVTEIGVTDRLRKNILSLRHLDPNLQKRVRLECSDDVVLRVSDNAFNLVMSNLIENAVKYSEPDAAIEISAKSENSGLRIDVKDQGSGLEKRERRRIFKMFYRGDRVTSKAIPGTGLGLFIVKTSLEQVGGRIGVESAGRGKGSTFSVWFPSHKARR